MAEFLRTEFGKAHIGPSGHLAVKIKGSSRPLHVLIFEKHFGRVPPGFVIHHIDHDKLNNRIENLEMMTRQDHSRHHLGWIKTNGEWSHKRCSMCKELKELSEFNSGRIKGRSGEYRIGIRAYCKKCVYIYKKMWRHKNSPHLIPRTSKNG